MSEEIVRQSGALVRNLAHVSRFQIKTLVVALVTAFCGVLGMGYHYANPPATPQPIATSADGQSLVNTSNDSTTPSSLSEEDPWTQWMSRKGFRVGVSFIGGFIIGFIFRTFIKTMALITICIVGVLGALSYFQILNIDFSKVEQTWNSNSEWIISQATKLKDLLWNYLPSSTTGTVGAFVGARRKSV